ncbi:hypothetical protein BU16DRAFT_230397 [Lophium mytilinum]|uniref:Rhodopsin domain-containing protein n=1 Tax=Lophium mytilinum TaxID=390894 RepID=A0A6A6QA53_9PEZI|nr:hypothetical protein BU16DRAFT_230397 [Lophium mytilinum]
MTILEPESAIWYTLCWLVVIARIWSRIIHYGSWKKLRVDDYLVLLAMVTDTLLMAFMHIVLVTSSNLIAPGDDISSFTPEEIRSRIYGSKLVLVVEQMQIITVWLIKACLLIMYNRMTMLLPQHIIVKVVAGYVAVGFVLMEILYFGVWCRPFDQYWAVPTNSTQCSAATNHLITNAVLNISSDLMIIAIPMPLLFKVKIPAQKKAILGGVFLIGTFTIVAAALNKYYSFTHPFAPDWTIWYLRESYTAILCANLPLTWQLLQRIFNLRNWSSNSYPSNAYGPSTTIPRSHGRFSQLKGNSNHTNSRVATTKSAIGRSRSDSQERINGRPLEIVCNVDFDVRSTQVKGPSQLSVMEMGDLSNSSNETVGKARGSESSSTKAGEVTTSCHRV